MRVKCTRRQRSALKKNDNDISLPVPYTGDGFVIETATNGKLSVYFKHAVVEWHRTASFEVEDILEQCVEMSALQAELMEVWGKIQTVGKSNGFQLTESFCATGFFSTI
jgi:hypothetical protein